MLEKMKQSLYNPLCLSCGSYFVQDHLFCNHCYAVKIEPRLELKKHDTENVQNTYSLFDWNPGESDLLSEMVYRFKSNRSLLAWQHYAELALKALGYELDLNQFDYIIPIPGSKKSSVHAAIFASIVSEIIKKPVLDILEKSKCDGAVTEQKQRSKVQRSQSQFRLRERFTRNFVHLQLRNRQVLMVDDIITTGNSYSQCSRVLGLTNRSALLILFYRSVNSKGGLVS